MNSLLKDTSMKNIAPIPDKANMLSVVNTDDYRLLKLGQKIAFHGALSGENQIITGGGGVGKSYLIEVMKRHIPNMVATATTGIASINILAQTVDSFMGFRGGDISNPERMSKKLRETLKALEILLIDEASMLRVDKIEAIDLRLRVAKQSDEAFGGVQIILVGDFMQLPPVVNKRDKSYAEYAKAYGNRRFLFESTIYEEANFVPYVLSDYIRQGNEEIRQVLRNIRMGNQIPQSINYLNSVAAGTVNDETIHLVSTNKKADAINRERYDAISNNERCYTATSTGEVDVKIVPDEVYLKVGARVMICVNNKASDYYNGDLGQVVKMGVDSVFVELDRGGIVEVEEHKWEFEGKVGTDTPEDDSKGKKGLKKKKLGSYEQIPLKLAWAITVHKSQGLTLKNVCIHTEGLFELGQAYVALSRPKDYADVSFSGKLEVKTIKFSLLARRFVMDISCTALARKEKDMERFDIAA
ncbi:MAG: hypothetical protein CBC55_05275 [Gammaproteobacteria bacterium TMED95]|nr:MAG: hypothetical protein CBC55_05275 [Gammaproteobacteria bacterium TMED95]|tara:strand:- start:842 stop:2254 length:1413 start_codon:yes stop_codon:yes gene_type:complete